MKLFFTTAVLVSLAVAARAQSLPVPQRTLITQAVDESRTVILQGNTHSLARAEFDQGPAPAELPMNRIQMLLRRSPEAESALAQFVEDQQNSASPEFHHWLSPEEFGERFGPSLTDIGEILAWLESHGFRVELVSAGRSVIEFSGNARAVREAFRTEIHAYDIHGSHHWANSSDPQVPAALAPVIAGIVSLHNFESKPQVRSMGWTGAIARPGLQPETNLGGAVHALSPGDYAVIYNATLLLNAGTNGSGRSIAVIGRSNINTQDIADFRRVFGLAANPFQVTVNGTDPGDLGGDEELEAVLDNSWAGALAPNASINFVVSASTNSSDGVFLSEQYAIDNNIADVISESFGSCEANYTQSAANYLSSLAEQAAAQGMTYVVATGDSGSAGVTILRLQRRVGHFR
ncbi:MAG: hypothetical protein JO061_03475 [Acidobacteriaceae bacterium]|nr:hypothetical protein [Acidobacteriaceae bacterium]